MSKLPSAELPYGTSPDMMDWMAQVELIINQGQYSLRKESSIPTGVANEGDIMTYSDGAGTRRLYIYIDSGWRYWTPDG